MEGPRLPNKSSVDAVDDDASATKNNDGIDTAAVAHKRTIRHAATTDGSAALVRYRRRRRRRPCCCRSVGNAIVVVILHQQGYIKIYKHTKLLEFWQTKQ